MDLTILGQPSPISHDTSPAFIRIISVAAPLTAIASLAVVARIFARKMLGVRLGYDDWTIVVALVFVYAILVALSLQRYIGYHLVEYTLRDLKQDLQVSPTLRMSYGQIKVCRN